MKIFYCLQSKGMKNDQKQVIELMGNIIKLRDQWTNQD